MFVKFNHTWGKYSPGDIANIELTLSRRLVGTGVVEYKTDLAKKTSPEAEKVVEKPEPVEEIKPEPEFNIDKKPHKKRKYKRPEKAVAIE